MQGAIIEENSDFAFDLTQTIPNNETLGSHLTIYTTAQDEPPDWPTDVCVKEGIVTTTFRKEDIGMAKQRWNQKLKKTVRKFSYEAKAKLQTEHSSLSFETFAYGRKAGSATFNVDLG